MSEVVVQEKTRTAATEDALSSLATALRSLRKHWPILVACILLSGGLSLLYAKSQTRIYQSTATIELDPGVVRPLSDKMDAIMPLGTGDFLDNREYYETQYKIITSTRVMEAAARDLGLQTDATFLGLKELPATPITLQQAAARLRSKVSTEPVRNSRLVIVKVDDPVPAQAKRLCDAVTAAYIEQNLDKAISSTSDSVVWLGGQVESVKKELEASEDALHTFKQKNDLPSTSINESSNMVRLELQELTSSLTHTRTRRQELQARLKELTDVAADNPDQLPSTELLSSDYLRDLRRSYQESMALHSALLAEGKGENHPAVKATAKRLAEAREALLGEIGNIRGAVARDLATLNRQEAGEAGLYESAHRRAVDLTMKEIEYHRLDRSREQNEKMFAMLMDQLKQADLARMMRVNNIHLIENGSLPSAPIYPKPRTNVAVGLFVGLVLGMFFVWVRTSLDNTIKTPEDIERTLGITFVGLLPANADELRQKGGAKRRLKVPDEHPELVVHLHPLSAAAEAARTVRTNLMFASPDKPFRRLLVTSSAPAEGKTTVACGIAIGFAQSGERVCLIDCDLRRPRLHRIFNRAGDSGLTNVLVGEAAIDDVALPTQIDNLYCIPSGPIPPNPAEIFHSAKFAQLLKELSGKFDRVIIDSPPLVAVTDAAILSKLVDGTVFVLRAFATTSTLARQGLRILQDVQGRIAGAVLNAVDLSRAEYSYYYYHYRRPGYGPREGDEVTTPAAPQQGAPPLV